MKVYLNSIRNNIKAVGEYDKNTGMLIVLKDSILSDNIAHSEKFRGAKSIESQRNGRVKDRILIEDIKFKSPSTLRKFCLKKTRLKN